MVFDRATRPLGRSGLRVGPVSLGAASLGNFYRTIGNAEAEAVVDAAWDAGLRYFDVAPFYGRGLAERRLGASLIGRPRDDYIVSTKVGRLLAPALGGLEEDGIFQNPAPFNSRYDYGYDGVMRSFEHSLQRLGLDRVDFLLAHDIGEMLHGADAPRQLDAFRHGGLKALEELRAGGAIAGYGLGVNETAACLDCLDYGDPDIFLLAGRFTLLEQTSALPLFDRAAERGVSIVVGGVFNSGILATGSVPGARYDYAEAPPAIVERVRAFEAVCERHAVPLAAAALHFPLLHPAVATVLLGVGTVASLQRNVEALDLPISAAFWQDLRAQNLLADGLLAATL